MTKLLEMKDQLIRFYSKYENYLFPAVKFVIAFVLFATINHDLGFMAKISTWPVALVLAVVCAILPVNAISGFQHCLYWQTCMHCLWKWRLPR